MTAMSVAFSQAFSTFRSIADATVDAGYFPILHGTTLSSAVTFARASVATYVNSSDVLQSAAVDVPRYNYSYPGALLLGLRIEGARTNMLTNSVFAGGAAAPTGYVQSFGTGTSAPAVSTVFPSGVTAYAQSATAQRPFFQQSVTALATTTYVISMYVESVTGVLYSDILGASGFTPTFRLNGASVAGGSAAQAGFLEAIITTVGGGATAFRFGLGLNGGVTGTIRFSCPQIEQADAASSFFPTTVAAAARAVDTATVSTLSQIGFNAALGTLVVDAVAPPSLTVAATLASFNDGTANEVIRLHMNAGGALRAQVIDGGVTVADLALGSLTASTAFSAALSYSLNDIKGCLNGGAVQTDAAATLPTVDRLMIGRGAAGDAWFGHVSVLRYYPTIQDTQAITAL